VSSSSNHNPGSRPRRRIAGERKPTRPTDATAAAASDASAGTAATGGTTAAGAAEARRPRESTGAEGDGPSTGRGRVRTPVLAALAALALALVLVATTGVGVAGLGVQDARAVQQQEDLDRAGRTAVASGERAAAAILAYSHKTLEADRDAAARYMTPEYREKYLDTFQLVLDNAPERRTVVQADVRASGVVHAETDRVNVLLFVNQTTTSTANSGEPQTALNRVVMQMARSGDTWLVDDITTY
jgi:Mce-associated membrane protein